MVRALTGLLLAALAAAQSGPGRAAFEVASLKPSVPENNVHPMRAQLMAMMGAREPRYETRPPGWLPLEKTRLTMKNRPLAGLIASAYRVRMRQVSGPAWLATARFDIEATFPEDTPKETVTDMLRTLLEERFGLAVHREEREAAGYALVETKGGAKLTPAVEPAAEEAATDEKAANRKIMLDMEQKGLEEAKQTGARSFGGSFWKETGATPAQIADHLASEVDKPVVDATGLKGTYDIFLLVQQIGDDTPDHAVGQALAKLGLKLEPRKVTLPFVVVDKVERMPKPN